QRAWSLSDLYRHSFRITLRSQQESARSLKIWMRLRQPSSSLPDQQSRLRSKQKVSNRKENCEIGRIQRLRSEIPKSQIGRRNFRTSNHLSQRFGTDSVHADYVQRIVIFEYRTCSRSGFGQDVLRLGRIGFDLLSKVCDK